jgi:hypothetical protein
MAERDAFGRLPDENPLAGLGSLSDGSPDQSAQPVVVQAKDDWAGAEPADRQSKPDAKPATAASSAWAAPPRVPRTGNPAVDQSLAEVIRQAEALGGSNIGANVVQSVRVVRRVVKIVVFLVVLGVVASVAMPLIEVGKDVRDAVEDSPSSEGSPPSAGGEEGGGEDEQAPPSGLSSNSMLTRRNFDRAMDRLSKSGLGRMRSVAIRPERIDGQLLTKGGSLRSVQIRSDDPEIKQFGTSGSGFGHLETIPFAKIDTGAPARLARSAAGRARLPLSRVDYITLNSTLNQVVWGAYMKGGKIYLANSRGRITRRIS